ncbi:unnamed protein product [Rhizopus stolonifer]
MFRRVALTLTAITLFPMSTVQAQPKAHHDRNGFKNPWPSFISYGLTDAFKMSFSLERNRPFADIKEKKVPMPVKMDWELIKKKEQDVIKATWLGHACVLLQINGFNILLDPIFSERCSPVQFVGPKRYTDSPCQLKDLPSIDAVVISHNHYDHLDKDTIEELSQMHPDCKFYVPLGNKAWFTMEDKARRVIELDWWEESMLQDKVRLTCTPCQHFTGRGLFDRNKTLWASWCIEGLDGGKIFFGGDTGYRAIPQDSTPDQQYDPTFLDTLPHCPVFKEIGEKFGGFDLALIPIGAYSPRWFMSPIHCCPEDAVRVHQDVKSKRSIGIHWGTFVLTDESVYDPPERLQKASKELGLNEKEFDVVRLGETFVTRAQ